MGNRAERGQSRVGTVGKLIAVGAISLGLGGVAEACGSNGDNTPIAPTANVLKTETPMPSATATQLTETPTIAPTPEPTPFQAKKLADAKFVPTSFETVVESFNKAFDAHPEAGDVVDEGGNQLNRERFQINLSNCENGDEITRVNQCSSLVGVSLTIYRQKQYEEFYQLAVDAANYFLTEIPSRQAEFDSTLQAFYHTSSPSTK